MAIIKIRKEPPTGTVWEKLNARITRRVASNAFEVEVRDLPLDADLQYLDGCQLDIDGRISQSVWGVSADRDLQAMTAVLVVNVLLL